MGEHVIGNVELKVDGPLVDQAVEGDPDEFAARFFRQVDLLQYGSALSQHGVHPSWHPAGRFPEPAGFPSGIQTSRNQLELPPLVPPKPVAALAIWIGGVLTLRPS
ncbi:MAG TPA: hypothetical protein VJT14_00595 [Candidatus Dormibacteraeota bacterium]|nr:hypothetical protein [Candidatus Dormibacteraeota bacterium]